MLLKFSKIRHILGKRRRSIFTRVSRSIVYSARSSFQSMKIFEKDLRLLKLQLIYMEVNEDEMALLFE